MSDRLKEKIRYLIKDSKLISSISELGAPAIFGGAIRDLFWYDVHKFRSDIDVVIKLDEGNKKLFDSICYSRAAVVNKWGGYRIIEDGREFDLWALEDTWAIKQGHVLGDDLNVLPYTTFFSVDSACYDIKEDEFYTRDNYFEDLKSRHVEIVCKVNPEPRKVIEKSKRLADEGYVLNDDILDYIREYNKEFVNV